MSMPPATALRVAECGVCRQLFAVYASEGTVQCPACAAEMAVAGLELAEIGVAASVEARVEPAAPEAPADPTPEPVAEQPADDRPPTVAEWLVRDDAAEEPAADPQVEPTSEARDTTPPAATPSLAESLGWAPGSFDLDGASNRPAAADAEPMADPVETNTEPDTAADFGFDFGRTPLAETPAETASFEPPTLDLTTAPDAPLGSAADERLVTPGGADAPREPRRRRWFGPLTAAAGLLVVAAPAAWLAMTWPEAESLVASLDRTLRGASDTADAAPRDADAFVAGPAALDSTPSDPLPVEAASDEQPIVDPQTRAASFNEPGSTSPSEVALPETPPAGDRYGAQPAPPEVDRYGAAPAGDRYASRPARAEPQAFTLPEDNLQALPPAPLAEPPVEGVRVLDAPTHTLVDLAGATAEAESAGRGFAEGDLADPSQAASMGKNYARLCYLAQMLTFLDPMASGPDAMTAEMEAIDVFRRLFREQRPRVQSRRIAEHWVRWDGRPHGGVFFAGVPSEMARSGEAFVYEFKLGELDVPVVVSEQLDTSRFMNAGASEVGVLGVIVDNPRERIAGYDGDAPRVVWVRKTLALRAPIEL